MKTVIFTLYFNIPLFLFSQSTKVNDGVEYSKSITAEELKSHLVVLASDSFGGREAGRLGQKMAKDYLVRNFKEIGISPVGDSTYLQKFPLIEKENAGIQLEVDNKRFTILEDFYVFNRLFNDTTISTKTVFVEFGQQDDYEDKKIKNNIVVFFDERETEDTLDWNLRDKVEFIESKGATAAFVISEKYEENFLKYEHNLKRSRMWLNEENPDTDFPVFYFPHSMAKQFFPKFSVQKFLEKGKTKGTDPHEVILRIDKPTEKLTSENVLAYIPGTDLKDELVVITAHYDHVGKNDSVIYNGADDDGSGTVALLEIAEAFMTAKKEGNGPRRSILIMPVSAEEKGLLGSKYYSYNPIFPLENTVANLNIDMIGRVDDKHEGNPNYIYLIGSDRLSQDLHDISESVAEKHFDIELDYTYNAPDDPNRFYYRSDHYNFAKHNIPAIFYFSGVHEDYHKPTDTVDKILFDKVEEISRLIFLTAWNIANKEERPQLNEGIVE